MYDNILRLLYKHHLVSEKKKESSYEIAISTYNKLHEDVVERGLEEFKKRFGTNGTITDFEPYTDNMI